jgi:hypothetical protein
MMRRLARVQFMPSRSNVTSMNNYMKLYPNNEDVIGCRRTRRMGGSLGGKISLYIDPLPRSCGWPDPLMALLKVSSSSIVKCHCPLNQPVGGQDIVYPLHGLLFFLQRREPCSGYGATSFRMLEHATKTNGKEHLLSSPS